MERFVLVGGSGFVGAATADVLVRSGAGVTVVDRRPPPSRLAGRGFEWLERDLLVDEPRLPDGRVVLLNGNAHPRARWQWTLPLDIAMSTARLLPALQGRQLALVSSVEVYGAAPAPLHEETVPRLPCEESALGAWCDDAIDLARWPCPGWRVAAHCRRLVEMAGGARWTYGVAKRAQEVLVSRAVRDDLTVLRLANIFGLGQERVITRFVRRAMIGDPLLVTGRATRSFVPVEDIGRILLADPGPGVFNVAGRPVALRALAEEIVALTRSTSEIRDVPAGSADDSCGVVATERIERVLGGPTTPVTVALERLVEEMTVRETPLFAPPLPVVVPPRPARPDEVADRQQSALETGRLKNGNRWSEELRARLRTTLDLADDATLLVTRSGTEALRLALAGTIGAARPGEVVAAPSFTYPTTVEVLRQLGYEVSFVDVDPETWNVDPRALEAALRYEQLRAVVCVDTFGNPCDYGSLGAVAAAAGVPLIADSAAAIGSSFDGVPVGTQAAAHAFSMSFAKTLSAGGAGGAVVFAGEPVFPDEAGWTRGALMDELNAVSALDQLAVLPQLLKRRARVASVYAAAVEDLPWLVPQHVQDGCTHSYVHWVLRTGSAAHRSALAAALARLGVETKRYFRALHTGADDARAGSLPVTELLDGEVLALPMSSELTDEDAENVALALRESVARMPALLRDEVAVRSPA